MNDSVYLYGFRMPNFNFIFNTFLIFRDVMSIGKKLAKERDEMCRELRRLHDATMELHDNMIMELQVLKEENNSLRRKDCKQEDNE